MANFVNWMQLNQPIVGDKLQMQGNPVDDHDTPSSGVATAVAPEGAQYAAVWADVPVTVEATNLSAKLGSGLTVAIPANTILEIPNIKPGLTTITMTDI